MTVHNNQGRDGRTEGRKEGKKEGERSNDGEVEGNKDVDFWCSQRDDPWPSRGMRFTSLSG
ncbi:hypothetical protein EYF80_034737 [Liparis tanakae]|uniref:Uncharacterized protein n=1 Tax=Liparis tanakae TaxID=230148 RepID=A0A4Z2GP19_9TELE|nr:hypothetical protein EYF80_034737 [Liparis tanakae]